ncbi:MAG: tetratricopeptide repeat protein, partial [Elusimicrobiota bacterium]|nr:tetratricopeptide repeat protein [Elusimicrobiota bacterium]
MTSSFYFTTAKYYISTNQRYLVKKEFENLKAVSDSNISGEIAYIYYSNNFFDEAVEEYKNAIAKQPTNVEFYNNLGVIFDKQKKYTDAISMYKKAIEISPSYSDAHYNLAVVYWNTGNWKGVVSELEKVLQINP